MRVLSLLAVGVTLASAAPLSVVVTEEISTWRVGRPAVGMTRIDLANGKSPKPSCMGRLRGKMQSGVAHLFALAGLGPAMPNAEALAAMGAPHSLPHHIAHMSSNGEMHTPPIWQQAGLTRLGNDQPPVANERPSMNDEGLVVARPHGHHHHHSFRPYHRHHGSFLRRVHRALMSLGPWEGRTVAFVLGCGIGVLLRMVWVVSVLSYRSIRGSTNEHEEEDVRGEYEQAVVYLPEEIFVAPPEYTDEKVDRAALDVTA